jgi:hypothetical protein
MSRRNGSDGVLGVALTPAMVVAAGESVPTVFQHEIELNGGANGARERLGAVLVDAAKASGLDAPALAVALLPPLSETRTIALPPLREDDRNRFLARNASRYFVGARGAQVIGTVSPMAARGAATTPVLATAAPMQLVQAVHAAGAIAGCAVRAVVPAEAAWAAAATAMWPTLARGAAHVAVARDDRTDLLSLNEGALTTVRRFRGAQDAAAIAQAVGRGAVGVMGDASAAGALAGALGGAGARVSTPDARWLALAERPDALAARFAGAAAGPVIRSEESREQDLSQVRRGAWSLFGIAAATLLVAGVVHYYGVKRELAALESARAAIRSQVQASLVGRSSVDAAYRQVASLATVSRNATRWSAVLADLAAQLGDNASLSAFRARGDSIFIDGVADQAAPVFDDLARVPGVSGVRATAPVRRESVEGQPPLEHFSLGAQITGARR